jgi:spermidine/putrescine transport system substrate-binding protein
MKKNKLLLLLPISLASVFALSGCDKKEETKVLRILNCEDYIYEYEDGDEENAVGKYDYQMDMVDQFIAYWADTHDGEEIEVVYDTFDTNETMFNELQTGKTTYDVIVPSDYMVQKLLSNDMLEKFDDDKIDELWENISPYLKGNFEKIKAGEESIYNYSIPYMWGTVGVMYNPEYYSELEEEHVHELFSDWDSLYGEELKGSFSIKDSVRDTYAVSLIHRYRDEIRKVSDNDELTKLFNRSDVETMAQVKLDMMDLKENAFGFECDSGKTDMTTQKIGANMCWSGDATWAITEAEEFDLTLYYSIPTMYFGEDEDGNLIKEQKGASNVWFDGFCMPKSEDLHKDLAQEFIKFMSQPENAAQNCYCVGYTPGVAGDAMLDYMYSCYDIRGEVGGEIDPNWVEGEDYSFYDLSYFFGGSLSEDYESKNAAVLMASQEYIGRQLTAQYPSDEIRDRLAIMNDFGSEGNARLLDMWEQVRTNALPLWGIIVLAVEVVAGVAFAAYLIAHKVNRKRFKKERRS